MNSDDYVDIPKLNIDHGYGPEALKGGACVSIAPGGDMQLAKLAPVENTETKVVDLSQKRAALEQPDANCVKQDDYGRPLYLFAYEFDHVDDKVYGFDFWAYDLADAEAKLRSIRGSARIVGQLYAKDIPA